MARGDLSTMRELFIWPSEWYNTDKYYNLLFEDLKIFNYLISIFYRLKYPTSFFRIRRLSNNFVIILFDIYVMRDFYFFFKDLTIKRNKFLYFFWLLKIFFFKTFKKAILGGKSFILESFKKSSLKKKISKWPKKSGIKDKYFKYNYKKHSFKKKKKRIFKGPKNSGAKFFESNHKYRSFFHALLNQGKFERLAKLKKRSKMYYNTFYKFQNRKKSDNSKVDLKKKITYNLNYWTNEKNKNFNTSFLKIKEDNNKKILKKELRSKKKKINFFKTKEASIKKKKTISKRELRSKKKKTNILKKNAKLFILKKKKINKVNSILKKKIIKLLSIKKKKVVLLKKKKKFFFLIKKKKKKNFLFSINKFNFFFKEKKIFNANKRTFFYKLKRKTIDLNPIYLKKNLFDLKVNDQQLPISNFLKKKLENDHEHADDYKRNLYNFFLSTKKWYHETAAKAKENIIDLNPDPSTFIPYIMVLPFLEKLHYSENTFFFNKEKKNRYINSFLNNYNSIRNKVRFMFNRSHYWKRSRIWLFHIFSKNPLKFRNYYLSNNRKKIEKDSYLFNWSNLNDETASFFFRTFFFGKNISFFKRLKKTNNKFFNFYGEKNKDSSKLTIKKLINNLKYLSLKTNILKKENIILKNKKLLSMESNFSILNNLNKEKSNNYFIKLLNMKNQKLFKNIADLTNMKRILAYSINKFKYLNLKKKRVGFIRAKRFNFKKSPLYNNSFLNLLVDKEKNNFFSIVTNQYDKYFFNYYAYKEINSLFFIVKKNRHTLNKQKINFLNPYNNDISWSCYRPGFLPESYYLSDEIGKDKDEEQLKNSLYYRTYQIFLWRFLRENYDEQMFNDKMFFYRNILLSTSTFSFKFNFFIENKYKSLKKKVHFFFNEKSIVTNNKLKNLKLYKYYKNYDFLMSFLLFKNIFFLFNLYIYMLMFYYSCFSEKIYFFFLKNKMKNGIIKTLFFFKNKLVVNFFIKLLLKKNINILSILYSNNLSKDFFFFKNLKWSSFPILDKGNFLSKDKEPFFLKKISFKFFSKFLLLGSILNFFGFSSNFNNILLFLNKELFFYSFSLDVNNFKLNIFNIYKNIKNRRLELIFNELIKNNILIDSFFCNLNSIKKHSLKLGFSKWLIKQSFFFSTWFKERICKLVFMMYLKQLKKVILRFLFESSTIFFSKKSSFRRKNFFVLENSFFFFSYFNMYNSLKKKTRKKNLSTRLFKVSTFSYLRKKKYNYFLLKDQLVYLLFKFNYDFKIRKLASVIMFNFFKIQWLNLMNLVEETLTKYTNKFFLVTPKFYYKKKPPMLSAKLLCDYIYFQFKKKKYFTWIFRKVRAWQHYSKKYYKSQFHYYLKKKLNGFKLSGIRIICSGPLKKARRKRRLFYHLWLRQYRMLGKMPLQSVSEKVDYYNLAVRTRASSKGIKVWLYFEKIIKKHKDKNEKTKIK